MKELTVRLTFVEDLLGTASANPKIHEEFIASKSPNPDTVDDEVEAVSVDEMIEKAKSIFPKTTDGQPFIYDYQIRGFFKEACSALKQIPGTLSSKIKAYKKKIDNLIFIGQRKILLDMHGMKLDDCQRSLRSSTPQGERTALANSDAAPYGTTIEFTVLCYTKDDIALVKEWLSYGKLKGLGQWRNSGKGRFSVEYLGEKEIDFDDVQIVNDNIA